MTEDADQERLERLRGDLADLRERATAVSAAEDDVSAPTSSPATAPELTEELPVAASLPGGDGDQGDDLDDRHVLPPAEEAVPRSFTSRAKARRRPVKLPVKDRPALAASREGVTREPPTDLLGRTRIPRPPRRNPLRRRPHKPPKRLSVPAPIPVEPRPTWMAAPRFPVVNWAAAVLIFLVLAPAIAQLGLRLFVAMERTSFLLGADPARADMLQAAAGVAGGGITLAVALTAVAIVRGRIGHLAAAGCVVLLFIAFPYMAYTANAGIVSAPLPTWQEMIQPAGWPRLAELQTAFVLAVAGLALAIADLVYRSVMALRAVVVNHID